MSHRRRMRTICDLEREHAAAMFKAHGERLAREREQDELQREAPIAGPARHGAELARRRELRRELEAAIDAPLIRSGLLTLQERREIWVREALRRRPVRAP